MADTLTANYGLVKPEVSGSDDTWGDKLNANLDTIDTQIKAASNAAAAAAAGVPALASTTDVLTGTNAAKTATPDAIAALWEKGVDVASAATIALAEGGFFHITGTVNISDIDFAVAKDGRAACLIFDGILTLVHSANLKLPGNANITTAAGDRAYFVQDVGDAVICTLYVRADGTMLAAASTALASLAQTLTNKRITPRVNTVVSNATPAINIDTTDQFTITALAAAITSMTTGLTGTPTDGQKLIVRIKDDGTARAIAWGASFASRGATLPTTTVLGKYLYVGLIYNSQAAVWDCVATAQE